MSAHSANDTGPDVRRAAVEALSAGLSVWPPTENGRKMPDGVREEIDPERCWTRGMRTLPRIERLKDWYGVKGPAKRTGLGVITGKVSGHAECLEFDAAGAVFEEFVKAAHAVGLGDLVERIRAGYEERTPSGGIHWLYRCPEGIGGNVALARHESDELDDRTGKPKIKPLIETRGEGGFVVVAPTYGRVHPTGKPYELVQGGFKSIAVITAQERDELFALARTFDRLPEDQHKQAGPAPAKQPAQRREDGRLSPIDDFNARADWRVLLHDWTWVYQRGDTHYLRRPGKDIGVSASLNRNGSDRLYVFSTSTPFDALVCFSKFAVYSRLNHGDDFSAAVKTLGAQGYGDPPRARTTRKTGGSTPGPEPSRNGHGPAPGSTPPRDLGLGDEGEPGRRNRTDLGNAERFIDRYGDRVRYCDPWGKWLVWDGRRWAIDETVRIRRLASRTARAIRAEIRNPDLDEAEAKAILRWAFDSEKRDRISAMTFLAQALGDVPILPPEMDPDPWLFNCRNGTLDLRTAKLQPHRRGDLITKLCPVDFDPGATCPLWQSTLDLVFGGDADLIDYWQRICGYALVGVVYDHVLPIAYGTGNNGKSTVLETLVNIFGDDYAIKAAPDLFMMKRGDSHPTERTDLFGKRLVVAIETEKGKRLNETIVKELTGGDQIRARRMREDFWQFKPTHTCIMATNHMPVVKGTDIGIWRRLRTIPFTKTIDPTQADPKMPERLKREYPGILAWCVRGCAAWQDRGLVEPAKIAEATSDYRKHQDVIGAFLDEEVDFGLKLKVKSSEVYGRYQRWCDASGERPESQKEFTTSLLDRGIPSKRSNGIWLLGIDLKTFGDTVTPPDFDS